MFTRANACWLAVIGVALLLVLAIPAAADDVAGCPGDYDCNGEIDFTDIDLLLAALGGETSWADRYQEMFGIEPLCDYLGSADANGDGAVDFFDIDAFIGLLGTRCEAVTLQISIGTRETDPNGLVPIGGNAGVIRGLEWVNLDGQTLVLDGSWQPFVFHMTTDPITAFAGPTADGVLDGLAGSLEHIRFRSNGYDGLIKVWIDDIADTIEPDGSPPITVTFGTFEGYADDEAVIFQHPMYSVTTAGNLEAGTDWSGVDNSVALSGQASYRVEFQFIDADLTRWLRLTTYNTPYQPNPAIRYDQNSVVSFWIRGIAE